MISIQSISQVKIKMVKIINLNKKKKVKARLTKEKKAAENRVIFGRTKKEKQIAKQESERDKRHLDAHKLEIKVGDQE